MDGLDIINNQYRVIIDINTESNVLPFRIFCFCSSRQLTTSQYSRYFYDGEDNVYDIKKATYEFDKYGRTKISTIRNFGEKRFIELLRVLNFYDQHVTRLLNESDSFDSKIFYKDQILKSSLVDEQIEQIIDYLFKYNNFIFGSLSDNQKEMIWKAIRTNRNQECNEMLKKLATVVTNYTTTTELQKNPAKAMVLSRFIIK